MRSPPPLPTRNDQSPLTLEARIASTNAGFFLKEFSFSRTQFAPAGGTEVELADHVVSIDDLLLVFQVKERTAASADPEQEERWFARKVKGAAVGQIRDTVSYLGANRISLQNEHGHVVDIPNELAGLRVCKLIVYAPGESLPASSLLLKGHWSSTAGFIHFFTADEYMRVLGTLITLPEVVDYLSYRERLCERFPHETTVLTEPSLLGHYLYGDEDAVPTARHAEYVATLENNIPAFELFWLLHKFKDRTYAMTAVPSAPPLATDYYRILKELAWLPRTGLAAFKERFMWAWEHCGGPLVPPSRFAAMARGCAFVFVPLPLDAASHAATALENFTIAAKYDCKVDRCVGLVFRRDGTDRLVDWMHYEHPWERDSELEARLSESYPFGPKRGEVVPTYVFKNPEAGS